MNSSLEITLNYCALSYEKKLTQLGQISLARNCWERVSKLLSFRSFSLSRRHHATIRPQKPASVYQTRLCANCNKTKLWKLSTFERKYKNVSRFLETTEKTLPNISLTFFTKWDVKIFVL